LLADLEFRKPLDGFKRPKNPQNPEGLYGLDVSAFVVSVDIVKTSLRDTVVHSD